MKKLKLLPSVLMMIMCVGVLAVGVFAISPIVSTIGGTLSISAAAGVKVAVYNSESMSANSLVDSAFGGANTEVDLGEISLDGSNATTASDVTPKVFYIKLTTNQDNKNYVVDTETIEYIDGIGVTSGEIIKNAGLVTKMHTYTATDGKGRACFNKTNPYTIKLSIKCGALSTEVVNMAFNLQLNIYEENDANFTDTEINGVDYLYFGSYPQSFESETLTGYTPTGETIYTSTVYTLNGSVTEFVECPIYLKTGVEDGEKYAWVESKVDNYVTTYGLFKIEPIKWNILKQNTSGKLSNTQGNTLLLSDIILESAYGGYFGEYDESGIRTYLNDVFYEYSFTTLNKDLIEITTVNNDSSTTVESPNDNTCSNTMDNIFALSYADLLNTEYGFSNSVENDASRCKEYSGLANARYQQSPQNGDLVGWVTRSWHAPSNAYLDDEYIVVDNNGKLEWGIEMYFCGIVPAMHISL